MTMKRSSQLLGALLLGWGLLTAAASAAEPIPAAELAPASSRVALLNTGKPGGPFGYYGFDISTDQRVAGRFTVPASGDFKLARIGVWLMNNSDTEQAKVKLSIQTDALDEQGSETLPSGAVLEHWSAPVATLGWVPVHQFFASAAKPVLKAGRSYWVVAESKAQPGYDPIWVVAAKGLLMSTTSYQGQWQTAGESAALTLRIDAVPVSAD